MVLRRPASKFGLKRPAKRPAGKTRGGDLKQLYSEAVGKISVEKFKEKTVSWVRNHSVPNKTVEVSCRKQAPHSAVAKLRMYCTSCSKCRSGKGWRGYAVLRSGTMTIVGKDPSSHGDFSYRYGNRSGLTDDQKGSILEYLEKHDQKCRIQHLMQHLRRSKCVGGFPEESTVTDFINNNRRRWKAAVFLFWRLGIMD